MKKNSFIYQVKYVVLSLLAAAVVGLLCMLLVYLLPVDKMKAKVMESASIQMIEKDRHVWAPNVISSSLDGFTDSIMLNIAVHPGSGNVLRDATDNACTWNVGLEGSTADILVVNVLSDNHGGISEYHYGRYWHGYLVFLKPMLLLFNYGEIRFILMSLELVLLFVYFYLLCKKLGWLKSIPFLVAFLALNPISSMLSLQFADIFIITLVGGICILNYDENKWQETWKVFLWIGIFTAYVDLLTYPLVGLGFNLILWCVLDKENSQFKKCMYSLAYSVYWLVGYALMWAAKWIMSITFNDLTLKNVVDQIFNRTAGDINTPDIQNDSIFNAIVVNVQDMFSGPIIALIIISVIFVVILVIVKRASLIGISNTLPLLFVALYPFIWCLIIRQHSALHAFLELGA